MPNGYWKSEEGAKAYQEIGQAYPETVFDADYDKFKAMTKNSPHSGKATEEVTKITRVLADDGKEYLMYDINEKGYDSLGNEIERFRGDIGKYPIPVPRYELRLGPDMTQQKVVTEILRQDVGYSIPFTASALEKLHKNANDKKQRGATQYLVQRGEKDRTSIANYEALKTGNFDELVKYGMTFEQWTEQQKAVQELHKVAKEAKSPEEEAEKATEALAEAGEIISSPPTISEETNLKRARRKETEGIAAAEPANKR